jgi:hypothetical protein
LIPIATSLLFALPSLGCLRSAGIILDRGERESSLKSRQPVQALEDFMMSEMR